jgi:hypothetical protein
MLELGKRAYGAMVWYVNVDGKDEREVVGVRSRCATRDLVREAMISCRDEPAFRKVPSQETQSRPK